MATTDHPHSGHREEPASSDHTLPQAERIARVAALAFYGLFVVLYSLLAISLGQPRPSWVCGSGSAAVLIMLSVVLPVFIGTVLRDLRLLWKGRQRLRQRAVSLTLSAIAIFAFLGGFLRML